MQNIENLDKPLDTLNIAPDCNTGQENSYWECVKAWVK